MTCKECKWFSTVYGGTCFGWADLSVADSADSTEDCPRFVPKTFNSENSYNYRPVLAEEYGEYDKLFK